ncbi:MAG TPA: hypothetical protein VF229_00460, partial [Burkholderiaceae bacterium]
IQGDSAVNARLDASLQVVAKRTASDDFKPEVTNANLRWQAADALSVRVGRVNNPIFLYSDYRLVHYALPGVRPPAEVYGLSPTYVMDGIDARWRQVVRDWRVELYGGLHESDVDAPRSNSTIVDTATLRSNATLVLSGEKGPWLLKGGVASGLVTYATDVTDALFDALRAIDAGSPGAAALADQLDLRGARYELYTLALRYDDGDWTVAGEMARRNFARSYYRDSSGAYLTAGYRIDRWLPYLTLARRKTFGPTADSRAGPLSAEVSALLAATRYDQRSVELGLARELGPGVTLKAQVEWLRPDANSWGASLTNQSPDYGYASPPTFRLISVNVDMVF